jgi:hypothetical protein
LRARKKRGKGKGARNSAQNDGVKRPEKKSAPENFKFSGALVLLRLFIDRLQPS